MPSAIKRLSLSVGGNPIYYRPGTPDKEVISDALLREEYDAVGRDLDSVQLIVDCGAYAGYSALFFLNKYPDAHLIAVEPDERNFEICRLNLQPYENRVTLVHAAVWSEAAELVLHRGELADGREWATMVKTPRAGETPDVRGVTLQMLLEGSGFPAIDILKMNIECSEEAVFGRNYRGWLPHVRNIIVQLHDERAEKTFFDAMQDRGFLMKRIPTLAVFTGIAAAQSGNGMQRSQPQKENELANGDFEDLQAAPAQIVPGGWLPGSLDIAANWHTVVCAPPFDVSLAVRTGRQHSGENALLVRMNPDQPVYAGTSPYAAIENRTILRVREGERWEVRAFIKASQSQPSVAGKLHGAYVFLRLCYDDGSTIDLPTEPLLHAGSDYVCKGGIVTIPAGRTDRPLKHATLWLYVWVVNDGVFDSSAADYGTWEVLFDDVSCARA